MMKALALPGSCRNTKKRKQTQLVQTEIDVHFWISHLKNECYRLNVESIIAGTAV